MALDLNKIKDNDWENLDVEFKNILMNMILENGTLRVKIRELEKRNENQKNLIQQLEKIINGN